MKLAISFTVQMVVMLSFLSFLPGDSFAGGGHAHFGRSEFVNGGMTSNQISQSLADIKAKTSYANELLQTGDLVQLEEVASSIRDLSSRVADNASMNRARNANLKRASKSISRAADKLKKYAIKGDAPSAEEQVERIHKLLVFAL